jgi:glyoxylase-like metal-dependent hydrolase (beta-lactamase superfamily II)
MRALLATLLLPSLAAAAPPGRDIRKTRIADGVWQFTTAADGYVEQLNSVVIVGPRDVIVYDTGTRPSDARAVLAEIRKLTDRPVRTVINSHWHPDHWSGNEVYAAAFPDVEIVASEETLGYMRHAAPAWPKRFQLNVERAEKALAEAVRTGKQADGTPLSPERRRADEEELRLYRDFVAEARAVRRTYPTLTYSGQLTLRRGGRELRLLSVAGDALGTTVLYLPREKVLATGDVVVHPIPYSTPAPSRRIETLKQLRALDVDVLVPGHGPAMRDRAYLDLQLRLLESVVAQVRAALLGGAATLDEVQQQVSTDDLRRAFAGDDPELAARLETHVRANLVPQAIREAREQDYR